MATDQPRQDIDAIAGAILVMWRAAAARGLNDAECARYAAMGLLDKGPHRLLQLLIEAGYSLAEAREIERRAGLGS